MAASLVSICVTLSRLTLLWYCILHENYAPAAAFVAVSRSLLGPTTMYVVRHFPEHSSVHHMRTHFRHTPFTVGCSQESGLADVLSVSKTHGVPPHELVAEARYGQNSTDSDLDINDFLGRSEWTDGGNSTKANACQPDYCSGPVSPSLDVVANCRLDLFRDCDPQEGKLNGEVIESLDCDLRGQHETGTSNSDVVKHDALPPLTNVRCGVDHEMFVLPSKADVKSNEVEPNILSRRLYVKKLFRRIPHLSDTTSILVKSKAHVKGKVGCRQELAMGNSNKIKTSHTFEEPVYDGKPLYAGVYNGLSPLKHVKDRVFREVRVKIDWYAHSITHQIKNVVTFYKELLRYIHPFQYQMLMTRLHELSHTHKIKVGLNDILEELLCIKRTIVSAAKNFNAKLSSVRRCRDAFSLAKAFLLEVDEYFKECEPCFDSYRQLASQLRKLPIISVRKPIVALVGHVNTGKSWLFQKLCREQIPLNDDNSSDDGETHFGLISDVLGLKWQEKFNPVKKTHSEIAVANYNFTTRSINVGNMLYKFRNTINEGQLLDTPGLLWKDTSKANPYERLTYATLKDLPTGVIYCFDVSNHETLDSQLKLYHMLQERFPHRPWINVVSKGENYDKLGSEEIRIVQYKDIMDSLSSMFADLELIHKECDPHPHDA
ncbi:nucleolar complex protein 4 like protein [Babesia gibsoni]|uniref:Nucleolar complex protein 4 like protein n=1 Tax=Babesia gibsoni TaxID=33632 RepID=A0AAD8LRI3_BABGI|nr:nucleolar complex protein 4 like protein [Babesia gibsoni]